MSLQVGWKYFPFDEIAIKSTTFCNSLDGLRIIQLSDLHLSKGVEVAYLKNLVKKINALGPDIVLFSGDILQTSALNVKEQLETFKDIKASAYYVTGNHDIVYGPKKLESIMQSAGVLCLDNKIAEIAIKGSVLQLVGLSDRYGFVRGIKRPIKELFSGLDPNLSTILLTHQPKDVAHIEDFRIDLQLSGHTHGGQIYPFNFVVKYFQPYISGLYRHKNTLLYVCRGLGYWGVRVRYRVPPEIPVFTIN
ncbi:metallophosphoesterase [Sulfurimonas crateris]|uniref:Metallophosphoesterase n=1 Tax=Sulfurimonas crateris TaxID=2574727 RepID=A0A4U2Z582_9BACT|nr:metallophosphoesterase [Sulfurimonas crateris]TKI68610.1 metallophosphoesterase [Sulfurimonas crateris]